MKNERKEEKKRNERAGGGGGRTVCRGRGTAKWKQRTGALGGGEGVRRRSRY